MRANAVPAPSCAGTMLSKSRWDGRRLLADRADDTRGRPVADGWQLLVLEDQLVIGRDRLHGILRLHEDDLVAAGLEVVEQVGRSGGGCLLEVVHQNDALAELLELCRHRLPYLFRLAHLEVE